MSECTCNVNAWLGSALICDHCQAESKGAARNSGLKITIDENGLRKVKNETDKTIFVKLK